MIDSKVIVVTNILADMLGFQTQNDSKGLLDFAQKLKSVAIELIQQDQPESSAEILKLYGSFFQQYKNLNADFTLAILPLFPTNQERTLSLLGTSDKIDEAIVNYRLDRTTFSRAKGHSIKHVVHWALAKGDYRMAEAFIEHVANDLLTNHPHDSSVRLQASGELISTIAWECELKAPVSKRIDQAIASLITHTTAYKLQSDYWHNMARAGLHESMLMMMKHNRITRLTSCAPEAFSLLVQALPDNPTPEQAHWITQSISHPELEQRILFDSTFDLDAFMVAMVARRGGGRGMFSGVASGDLTFKGLSVFREWMAPEHLDTTEKKRRVALLLNAAADNHFNEAGSPKTTKAVSEEFDKQGLPATARRIMKMFKVQQLEDELGL